MLMILGCVLLGIQASKDRPAGVSNGQYMVGFFAMLGCLALFGALLPFMERCLSTASQNVDYCVFLQFQVGLSLFATVFAVIGLTASKEFQGGSFCRHCTKKQKNLVLEALYTVW
ncbi:hypothetical protein Syun_004892 [Stephania yunnanensis]|uniref:Uncharacterized protein n=1 Tax=Stephania yunnanensis TaxID=152371 RepID=A0AAP0Q1U6_9MAGN